MNQQNEQVKALRIAIVHSGRIIDERLLRQHKSVTIGESSNNTFVLHDSGFTSHFPMFESKNNQYHLNVAEIMEGSVLCNSESRTLKDLKEQDTLKLAGELHYKALDQPDTKSDKISVYQMPLTEQSKGKIKIGEYTVLFQFVNPPPLPAQPKETLLKKLNLHKGVDWVYSSILLVSLLAHTGFVYLCKITGELPAVVLTERIAGRFDIQTNITLPNKPKNPVITDPSGDVPKPPSPKPPSPKPPSPKPPSPKPPDSGRPNNGKIDRDALQKKFASVGLIGSINGQGPVVKNLLNGTGIYNNNLDAVLRDSKIVVADGRTVSNRTSRDIGPIDKIDIKTEGEPHRINEDLGKRGGRQKVRIPLPIVTVSKDVEGGKFNQVRLMTVISEYRTAIQLCYERGLRQDPNLRGRLIVRLTIALKGHASAVDILDNELNNQVGECLQRLFRRPTYPCPQGSPAIVELPIVFSPSN